jgi:hypothetical protein
LQAASPFKVLKGAVMDEKNETSTGEVIKLD